MIGQETETKGAGSSLTTMGLDAVLASRKSGQSRIISVSRFEVLVESDVSRCEISKLNNISAGDIISNLSHAIFVKELFDP